jgi:hypothetical protein
MPPWTWCGLPANAPRPGLGEDGHGSWYFQLELPAARDSSRGVAWSSGMRPAVRSCRGPAGPAPWSEHSSGPEDARFCRIAGVAFSHIYALNWMPSPAAAIVNSAFRPEGSAPNADYALCVFNGSTKLAEDMSGSRDQGGMPGAVALGCEVALCC